MHITVVAVGRLKERFWRDAADEYLKRLGAYADVRVVEISDRDPGTRGEARALAEEGADVLKALPQSAHVIALTLEGSSRTSEEFAAHLEQLGVEGRSSIALIVGGSHGLDGCVLARANEQLSLGALTFPHNLARIIVLEQVYRAFRIIRGEPYHK